MERLDELNRQLRQLVDQMARRHKVKAMVEHLEGRQLDLASQARQLKEQTYREQLDVDRLEGFSLAKLFYQLSGRLDEQLEKEEAEACAAALRYDAKRRELETVERDLADRRRELDSLENCQETYQRLLEEKAAVMKSMNAYYGDRICALEERITYLGAQDREIQEAIQAGQAALVDIDAIQGSLSSAEGWGTFDLLGGGLISDIAKHSHLDEAQRQVNALQRSLSRFRTELADVAIQADLQIQVDGFLRFADYFFDGIFADWAVMDRIRNSKNQVADVERSVRSVLDRLNRSLSASRQEREAKKRELDELVLQA